MSPIRKGTARSLYLELASLGIDVRTGSVPELPLSCAEMARLMRRILEHRQGLRRVIADAGEDLEAIREEAGRA